MAVPAAAWRTSRQYRTSSGVLYESCTVEIPRANGFSISQANERSSTIPCRQDRARRLAKWGERYDAPLGAVANRSERDALMSDQRLELSDDFVCNGKLMRLVLPMISPEKQLGSTSTRPLTNGSRPTMIGRSIIASLLRCRLSTQLLVKGMP